MLQDFGGQNLAGTSPVGNLVVVHGVKWFGCGVDCQTLSTAEVKPAYCPCALRCKGRDAAVTMSVPRATQLG